MKRSEMIKIMEENYSEEMNMDKILSVIEKAGMLPPRNPNATFEQQLEHNGLNFWEED